MPERGGIPQDKVSGSHDPNYSASLPPGLNHLASLNACSVQIWRVSSLIVRPTKSAQRCNFIVTSSSTLGPIHTASTSKTRGRGQFLIPYV